MPIPAQRRDYGAEYKRRMQPAETLSDAEIQEGSDRLLELAAKKDGRPTTYDDVRAVEILRRIQDGETLTAICADEDMPGRATVYWWMTKYPRFADAIARARANQGESWGEKAVDVALANHDPKDKVAEMRRRTAADTLLKAAGRRDPERWGDKPTPAGGLQIVFNTNLAVGEQLTAGRLVATSEGKETP